MRTLRQYWALLTHMGPGWIAYRAGYALWRKTGLLKRATPTVAWEELPVPGLTLHTRKVESSAAWGEACVEEAEAVLRGEFRLFSHRTVRAGFPPDWHRNQMTEDGGRRTENGGQMSEVRRRWSDVHWSEISDAADGDIKGVWELSRFSWAFSLARAFARTGEVRFKEGFWRLFEDWCRMNPPNLGPNWMCGQEATFRLMAVTFAAEAMGVPESSRERLARFITVTGRRIAANLDYALSQRNNHGVSECVGLITVALLAPQHAESDGWMARGLRELEKQLNELLYNDGGFSQHSLIYHRVLLHDLCWCRDRLQRAVRPVPPWLDAAGKRALGFLLMLTDPATGRAPLYGANDGSAVLQLAEADYLDMRPTIQLAAAAFRGELSLPEGSWDEAAAWMGADGRGLKRVPWPESAPGWHAKAAGCLQLINGPCRLFLRCPEKFRHRPGHADMLHVDVWHKGRPVAMDGGSFSYNSRERFTALGSAAQHNVLTVDDREPMRKFSRFLYLPWPSGRVSGGSAVAPAELWRGKRRMEDGGRNTNDRGPRIAAHAAEDGETIGASHDGYAGLGIHWTRSVSPRPGGGFIVKDRVTGGAGRALCWHWRLSDAGWRMAESGDAVAAEVAGSPYSVRWHGVPGASARLMRADESSAYGWWSPHYGEAAPACSLLIETEAAGDVELVTEFQPQPPDG